MLNKRSGDDLKAQTPQKKPARALKIQLDSDDEECVVEKVFNFRVLLPNGVTLEIQVRGPMSEIPVEDFVILVKREYQRRAENLRPKRPIQWTCPDLHLVDAFERKLTKSLDFSKFGPNKSHMLRLCDGSTEADKYENMWDLTPDTDLLKELPEEYTFETALADLIDNSLQAVWSNHGTQRRLISLELNKNRITIFDTGPGMDGSAENSIVKWGKMGASLHRLSRDRGIGGKPPYLMPFFGMFGYGGPIASMHLGSKASVSSKTKESKKVFVLHLERDSLLSSSSSQQTWRTDGSVRDPLEDESRESADGSFTKVEIFHPKMRSGSVKHLQYKLKDIYFPYIQCDEVSSTGRTLMPIEFQVNGTNLTEIAGGEVATTNLLSCNGPEFILQLRFQIKDNDTPKVGSGKRSSLEANARLRCVYFPVVQGKESIEVILENLVADGHEITENFESFSHVSVRRLGRLLPDARWAWLPFMEPKQRKGARAEVLKRCCFRVKCFVETDAGFNPTPSKTDLAHHHPYTVGLKNFGNKPSEKEKDVHIDISRDGKKLSILQVEKLYQEWLLQMHDRYDEVIDRGEDQPTFVLGPSHKKELGVSSDVMRVHKVFQRKGITWKSGQKIKILKGAYKGFHNNNVYATLEFIILEGCQGDSGGEARIICRPLDVPDDSGSQLTFDKGTASIEIRNSKSLPLSVIDTGKCVSVDITEWESQVLKHRERRSPSSIDLLDAKQCQELGIEGALPQDVVDAGHEPPEEFVAVVRPASFSSITASASLDQKYILKESFEMTLEVKFIAEVEKKSHTHIYSGRLSPLSHKGFHGLYIFPMKKKLPNIFQKAGSYSFRLSIDEGSITFEKKVQVKALSEAASWKLISDGKTIVPSVRVGSCFPEFLSVACYDKFSNRIPFMLPPEIEVKCSSSSSAAKFECSYDHCISRDRYTMKFKNVTIESGGLDMIRPSYEATLHICSMDDSFSVAVPFAVIPGPLQRVLLHPVDFGKNLAAGMTIKELTLETFDKYGNHLRKDELIKLKLDGLRLLDKREGFHKVDDHGYVNLSGNMMITAGYGKSVSLSVFSGNDVVFQKEFQTEIRSLRVASKVPKVCAAGSYLEDIVFEVINSLGEVDEDIHDEEEKGHSHTLVIRQDSVSGYNVKYSFLRGRCVVGSIPLPKNEGFFCFVASHSRFQELQTSIEVHVEKAVESKHAIALSRCSKNELMLLEDSSSLKTPGVVYDLSCNEFSVQSLLPFNDSCASPDLEVRLQNHREKKLVDNICKYGLCIRQSEANLEALHVRESNILLEMSNLKACIGLDSFPCLGYNKDMVVKRIERKPDRAAAVVHRLLTSPKSEQLPLDLVNDILGVTALLGEVKSHELSCMLSAYLGEDQMLAVVCKSRAAARALEKYQMDGNVNCTSPLDILAAKLGMSINCPYLVVCLEDIRPYTQGVNSAPQRELALRPPILSDGRTPPGFLGYAVNMIFLQVEHLQLRTSSGHGLRETLFFRLFGKLQVYESKEHLYKASSCIEDGAVSLDGGMMRGNGVVSVGFGEPHILFPVSCLESQLQVSPKRVEILKRLEVKKLELSETQDQINEETSSCAKYKTKLARKLKIKRELEELGPLEELRPSPGMYSSDMDISSPTS